MKRAALYIRVSTSTQADEGLSIPAQEKLLRDYATSHGYCIEDSNIYIDAGESAKSADRPAFQLMITQAKKTPKQFDAVLVHKTDRFARNRLDSAVYKTLLRKECGIDVISITENFSNDPYGVMMEGIMELFAEFYSLNLSAEVTKGMTQAAESGIVLNRVPFGYVIEPSSNKYCVDENQAKIIKHIFHLYVELGYGMDRIHQYLNSKAAEIRFGPHLKTRKSVATKKRHLIGKEWELKWSRNTINYILKNDVYIGTFRWKPKDKNEIVVENNHDAIIEKSVFDEAQKLINKRRTRRAGRQNDYLLRGLIKCTHCGRNMVIYSTKRKEKVYNYLRCSNKSNDLCKKNGLPYNKLLQIITIEVSNILNKLLTEVTLEIVSISKRDNEALTLELQNELNSISSKFEKLLIAYQDNILDLKQLKHYKEKLENERQILEIELLSTNSKNSKIHEGDKGFLHKLTDHRAVFSSDYFSEYSKQRALACLIDKITVDKSNKEIKIIYTT